MHRLIIIFTAVFLMASNAIASTTIGSETALPLQSSQAYCAAIGDSPDDDSVQYYNPPLFTWLYQENPEHGNSDVTTRTFRLQLTTNANASFASPYWNIATSNNVYNFLPRITNANGSTFTGTNYWRVIYYSNDMATARGTSAVHHLTLSASATNWDRSMLADSNYLYSVIGQHPMFMFNAGNKTAVSNYAFATSGQWNNISNTAVFAIAQTWWTNESVYTNQSQSAAIQATAQYLYSVAFMYQMSSDPLWTNCRPDLMFDLYVKRFIALDQMHNDPYTGGAGAFKEFVIMADWLWPILSTACRSNTVYAMEESVKFYVYEDWWYEDSGNYVTNVYNWNTREAGHSSAFKVGNSHARYATQVALMMSMCCWSNSQVLRDLLDYPLNYSLAVKEFGRGEEGRGYNLNNWQPALNWGGDEVTLPIFSAAHLERSPVFQKMLALYCYTEPLNYQGLAEQWGDLGYGIGYRKAGAGLYNSEYIMTALASFTGNGAALQQATRQDSSPDILKELEWASGYYNSNPPTQIDWPSTAYIDTLWGYCVAGSLQPNAYGSFTNGVTFVTQARPGPRLEHGNLGDGAIELWAYGARISAGGIGNYRKNPTANSAMVFVDGIGEYPPYGEPTHSVYSRFTAFTNSSDFTFVSRDTRNSYNLTNLPNGLQQGDDVWPFYSYATNARPYLTTMQRNTLFPHKKYLVLYDSMTTSQAAKFQWLWHYMEPTGVINSNGCSFTYTATNMVFGSNVTVYVVPFIDPTTMSLTSLPGTNNYSYNPITGENYNQTNFPDTSLWEPLPNGSIWVQNNVASTIWHFGWIVYPVKWGESAPTITRISDTSVRIQHGTDDDTISINNSTGEWTMDLNGSGGSGASGGHINLMRATTIRAGTVRVGP